MTRYFRQYAAAKRYALKYAAKLLVCRVARDVDDPTPLNRYLVVISREMA